MSSHQPSFFNRPIDHQSTSNDRLKPVMTTGLVNMHIDRSIANLDSKGDAHAPVNGGPVFPGTILGYFGLIKHFLAEFLLFSIILYITLAL